MSAEHVDELAWNDNLLLGYEPMDAVHREFLAQIASLSQCAEEDLADGLARLHEHLKEHFGAEDALMVQHDFPPRDCHIDEHAAVLKSARDVLALVQEGDVAIGRDFVAHLADWFPGHTTHLDSALAHWMVKRLHGGKPVVLRRHMSFGHGEAELSI